MNAPTDRILAEIERLQNIQKRNRYGTKAWRDASAELQPLFAEMARRQRAGDPLLRLPS